MWIEREISPDIQEIVKIVHEIFKKKFTYVSPAYNTVRKWFYDFNEPRKEIRDYAVKLICLTLDNYLTNKYQDIIFKKQQLTNELNNFYGKDTEKDKEIGKVG